MSFIVWRVEETSERITRTAMAEFRVYSDAFIYMMNKKINNTKYRYTIEQESINAAYDIND